MRQIFKLCFLSTVICFTHVGCVSGTTEDSSASIADKTWTLVKAENQNGYSKPGANVALRHNYYGHTAPKQIGYISIDLVMPPTDGVVTVSFSGSKGLTLLSGAEQQTWQVNKTRR